MMILENGDGRKLIYGCYKK